jgi:protein O-GlcNAc transferase
MDDGLLRSAYALQQAGNLTEAARLYGEIARANPRNFDALCLLGMAHAQLGQREDAQQAVDEALRIVSQSSRDLYNLGCLLQRLSRHEDALKSYDGALSSRADYFEALVHRGLSLLELKRFEDAVASFERALSLRPAEAGAWLNRGNALLSLARHDEALVSYDRALSLKADFADVWENRGHALLGMGRSDDGLACYDKAASLKPGQTQPFIARGKALIALKRYEEALASFDGALIVEPQNFEALFQRADALLFLRRPLEALPLVELCVGAKPDHVDAWVSNGAALAGLARYEEALTCYDRALALKADCVEALVNRALAFNALRRPEDALANADAALSLVPNEVGALLQRGNALSGLMRYEDAIAAFELCSAVKRDYADPNAIAALSNRGGLLIVLKRFDEAIAAYEELLRIDPLFPYAAGNLLHCRLYCCNWRNLEDQRAEIEKGIRLGAAIVSPHQYVATTRSAADQLACTQLWVASNVPSADPPWQGTRYGHDRIRVAYLSEEFRTHAMPQLMAGVWEEHDRKRFEMFAVSFGPDDGSQMRARIERSFEHFIDIRYLSDREAVRTLEEREIDILVDLMGYTGFCRPGILALRPAPVQVNYLGFPSTMGADFVDYILADRTLIGEDDRRHYSERVVYLPDSYMATDRSRRIAEPRPSRAEVGLPAEGFVFCCFNNPVKIGPQTFDIWMRLVKAVEGSVVWLLDDNPAALRNLKREAEARGVSAQRLVFAPRKPLDEHLARLRQADLVLDTEPCNAHTTASDALWAGVPVLTMPGETFASRVAASLLKAIGLPDLVTDSPQTYEAMALHLARDAGALRALKARLAANRETCPLFDTVRFTRNLEKAYFEMWARAERGEAPAHFAVTSVP